MPFTDKEFLYNRFEKPPIGGSSYLTVNSESRIFSVHTSNNSRLNETRKELLDPCPEVVAELISKRSGCWTCFIFEMYTGVYDYSY